MKKLYNSPELEIVKFTILEAIADTWNGDQFSQDDGDIFVDPDETVDDFG